METTTAVYEESTSRNWSSDDEINRIFIRNVFNYLADTLEARGHLFLNEVHDQLGLLRTSRGQLIGWVWPVRGEIWEMDLEDGQPIKITFHTQGEIYDKIES